MSSLPDDVLTVPHYVYRCFGRDGVLLYVGVARDVESRMFHHLHDCNAGKQPNATLRTHMARYDVKRFPTKAAARQAEREAILIGAPLVNRQHNPRRFRKANTATYGLVAPVHPITAEAFPHLPRFAAELPDAA